MTITDRLVEKQALIKEKTERKSKMVLEIIPAHGKMKGKSPHGAWGKNLLPRFKDINGKRYQLHATKGWRCVGKVEGSNNA